MWEKILDPGLEIRPLSSSHKLYRAVNIPQNCKIGDDRDIWNTTTTNLLLLLLLLIIIIIGIIMICSFGERTEFKVLEWKWYVSEMDLREPEGTECTRSCVILEIFMAMTFL
jgi:nitrate reductase gamma subunit